MKSTTLTMCNHEIMITQKRGVPSKNWGHTRYKHAITLKTPRHAAQKFYFYSSRVDYQGEKSTLDNDGLKDALECFVSDATAGDMDIDEFQGEFGYEKASDCIKAHKGCIATADKMAKLGISGDDLYDIANALQEWCGAIRHIIFRR